MTIETCDKLLLCATEAAALCGVSRSLWWSMQSAGKVPLPIHLSRRTLWRADELRDWTRAGCPSREKWETIKGTQNV